MTTPTSSSSELWSQIQRHLPPEERRDYNESSGFVMMEKYLKERLLSSGRRTLWDEWTRATKAEIAVCNDIKYGSAEYQLQRTTEQERRGEDWALTLTGIIEGSLQVKDRGIHILDVGANSGEEVSGLPFKITCVDTSKELCYASSIKYPNIEFIVGDANSLPFKDGGFDAYLSLRTWCVAGVRPDEALSEARRVVRSDGLIVVSFPLTFGSFPREIRNARDPKNRAVAEWTHEMFSKKLAEVKTLSMPEDYFIIGKA